MNAERLLKHYERIADAPDAIPRLRRFILDLAVRGKLVPQDPSDEPASELLKRIERERSRLVSEGKFREPVSFVRIDRGDMPFGPPPHWIWSRLVDIASPAYGFAFPSTKFNSANRGMPLIRIRDISSADAEAYFDGEYDPSYVVVAGDYLVGMDGDFNLRRWDGKDGLLNQRVMRLNGWRCGVEPEFVKLPLQFVFDYLHGVTSVTTVKHLSAKQVNGIEIPLPPIEEQQRIVAKVGELMALCDSMEKARAEREAARDRLAASSLARLNAPEPHSAGFASHAQFAFGNLTAITFRADQIRRLRQSIVGLAVRGKLVRQDPTESAAQSPERYDSRSRRLTEVGDTSVLEMANVPTGHGPFNIPSPWRWAAVETLCEAVVDCPHSTPSFVENGVACVDTNCFKDGALIPHRIRYVSEDSYRERTRRLAPRPGDVVFAREGSVGASVIVPEGLKCCLGQRVMLFRLWPDMLPRYFSLAISEPSSLARLLALHKGIGAKHVNVADMRRTLVPVPPFGEQNRIVAKVDELMALCDKLEVSLVSGEDTRRRLLDALLAEALAPATTEVA